MSDWSSAGWWTGVSGLATVLGLLLAFWAYLRPRDPSRRAGRPRDAVDGVARSPWLGLELWQDGKRVLFEIRRRGRDSVHPVVAATLRSGRFELRFAALPPDRGLHVAAWTDGRVHQLRDGMTLEDTEFFEPGTGLADSGAGSEVLVLTPEAHTYWVGPRLGARPGGQQALGVADLHQGLNPIRKPWGDVYLTAHRDGDDLNATTLDLADVEFLLLHFG
jgi:hypothetical protein